MVTTILKLIDTFVFIATTSSSITLSVTRIGLKVIPVSIETECGLSTGNKVIYEKVMQKYNKYKNQFEKEQQTIKSFDKIYRKAFQDKRINDSQNEPLCNIFTR